MSLSTQAAQAAKDAAARARSANNASREATGREAAEKLAAATDMVANFLDVRYENVPVEIHENFGGRRIKYVDWAWYRVQLDDVVMMTRSETVNEKVGTTWRVEVTCIQCGRLTHSGSGGSDEYWPQGHGLHLPFDYAKRSDYWRSKTLPEFVRNIGSALTTPRLCPSCYYAKPAECPTCGRKDR